MLTKREIEIVQSDWAKVELMGDVAATLLYDRLFSLDPGARTLFSASLAEQKTKLLRMIGSSIAGLSKPEILDPILQYLGRKHEKLGVQNHQYATVGAALLWTLKLALGAEFDPEHESAWTNVYAKLSETMRAVA